MKKTLTSVLLVGGVMLAAPRAGASSGGALRIDDVVVEEGQQGVTLATFKVTLSGSPQLPVTVHWATQDLTAQAGSDYRPSSGELRFDTMAPRDIVVQVFGDVDDTEGSEVFLVRLSGPTHAAIVDGVGHGVIADDDRP